MYDVFNFLTFHNKRFLLYHFPIILDWKSRRVFQAYEQVCSQIKYHKILMIAHDHYILPQLCHTALLAISNIIYLPHRQHQCTMCLIIIINNCSKEFKNNTRLSRFLIYWLTTHEHIQLCCVRCLYVLYAGIQHLLLLFLPSVVHWPSQQQHRRTDSCPLCIVKLAHYEWLFNTDKYIWLEL